MVKQMTTEFKGTPGPWEYRAAGRFVFGADDQSVALLNPQGRPLEDGTLIAAAPDLLAALVAAAEIGHMRPFANEDQAFWDAWLPRADAAIAKALGS